MNQQAWSTADNYLTESLGLHDSVLAGVLADSEAAGLPSIQVSAPQGKLLYLLARIGGARRILEVGTLAGYSTIWLARGLPADGVLVSLELESRHAEVARANLERAGLADRVQVRVGAASESLAGLVAEGVEPFDLVFVDADKEGYPDYLQWALRLTRPGSVLVFDNVVRGGRVLAPASDDTAAQGARRMLDLLADEPRVSATVVQTVGEKGYDGFALALVTN